MTDKATKKTYGKASKEMEKGCTPGKNTSKHN